MKSKPKNPAAVALGRLAKGVSKTFSPEEIALRVERIKAARLQRWAGHVKKKK